MTNKCIQYYISRKQRQDEVARGDGLNGTKGYEVMGCYRCEGYNRECKAFSQFHCISAEEIYEDFKGKYLNSHKETNE